MAIRIGRTQPPAAAPIPLLEVLKALPSCFQDDVDSFDFEEEIKKEFDQRYCLLLSSGKAALVLILKALCRLYPERDEVLIPAFTCYSVPAAIKKAGLQIRLCDMGERSLDFDKVKLANIIEEDKKKNKILCVLVTHLFGCPADFDTIKEIVGDKIPIVEDAAQAMGEERNFAKLGTKGDAGFFSMGRGKALSTMEGGAIVTSRQDLGDILNELARDLEILTVSDKLKLAVKTILITLLQLPFLFWLPKMLPFLRLGETIYEDDFTIRKMSSFQKHLACNWQVRLKLHQKVRKKNGTFWQENLPKTFSLICAGKKQKGLIRLPILAQSTKERDLFCLRSEESGLGVMPSYPTPINEIPNIAREFAGQHFPNAKILADCLMTLPVHEYIGDGDQIRIKNTILEFTERNNRITNNPRNMETK